MSKRKIAVRMMKLGFRIGRYAKNEIEKEAKAIIKQKLADKKTAKKYVNMMLAEARKMKARLDAYAKAEMKMAGPKKAKKKKK